MTLMTQSDAAPMSAWPAIATLAARELVRFFRQRNRVIGAIGQPVIFWLLFGAGLGPTFRLEGEGASPDYLEYFFPGTLVLILLFTAIFATISIIEDRREGFLQSVLVAPVPRWAMVLGKILGGAAIAMIQGLIFFALVLTLDLRLDAAAALAFVGFMALLAIALTALGFIIAWRMDSTQGFHAIMSVFLMPMWLLSGSFFPAPTGGGWIDRAVAGLMHVNPLTYGVAGLRRLLYLNSPEAVLPPALPSWPLCLGITLLFTITCLAGAWLIAAQRVRGDLL
jgi:ABC-2 type transport system permease protein